MQLQGIKELGALVADDLSELERYMKDELRSKATLLDTVIRYILRQRGKRARPTLVFLSASACGGTSKRATVGAAMIEMLHTATLVHDDVVDHSSERRGMASINAVWKNKIAVLVGDYLLSRGLLIAVNNNEFEFLRITSRAVQRMSEGELLQIQKSRQRTIDEDTYFKIIADKTASLISACCEIGAVSAGSTEDVQVMMRDFGELIGQAFQIRDDVLDYTSRSVILGKPVGNDIAEQKITLPLIYACATAPHGEGASAIRLVKGRKPRAREIELVTSFVNKYNGVAAAQAKAVELQQQAIRLLQALPDTPFKTALVDFATFVVERST